MRPETVVEVRDFILAIAGFIVTVSGATAVIMKAWSATHRKQEIHDGIIKQHEEVLKEHGDQIEDIIRMLDNDNRRLKEQEESDKVTQHALLSIMNSLLKLTQDESLNKAKSELEEYLIEK